MSLSEGLRSKITELETIMNSGLWKEHFSIESKASENWKRHFGDYQALQLFDANTKQLLAAITRILSVHKGMHNSEWQWLWDATVENKWLIVFLDEREPYFRLFRLFNDDKMNPDDYKTWDVDRKTWVEKKGIRVQLADLIHETKAVLAEIQELYRTEYVHPEEEITGVQTMLLQLRQFA